MSVHSRRAHFNIIENAASVVNSVVNKVQDFLPDGGGSYDDGGYDGPVKKAATVATPMVDENIPEPETQEQPSALDIVKKNALPIGLGVVGLAAAFFLMRRKNPQSRGMSGVRAPKRNNSKGLASPTSMVASWKKTITSCSPPSSFKQPY